MDGGTESLAGYRSGLNGAHPELLAAGSKVEEIADLTAQIVQWAADGVEPSEIGVAVRYLQLGKEIAHALEQAELPVRLLGGTQGPGDGVSIGTMHRMKGLEFRFVAVAGVSESVVPLVSALTPVEVDAQQHRENRLSELSLLFVACTRAREAPRISWNGAPGPFLAR
ncbi:3'-5' exonuclease [Streptomyces sp. TN58]|uniref:3'-5' exonuclease n=1 Tax=Streptomyces sp. TN58 TaxID=234612 RepID=UPI000B05B739|nr:3'-5' exonuclease [Streptomyces sp. TN58]